MLYNYSINLFGVKTVDIIYFPSLEDCEYEDQVWQILCAADHEFVPPLSCREGTSQSVLTGDVSGTQPESYFAQMKEQPTLLAVSGNAVCGIMSFRRDYAEIGNCAAYVSTVIVRSEYRGSGLAEKLYHALFETEKGFVVTRTWSENAAHIHILDKLRFRLIKRIKDHRGQGIDTVYYGKENV